MSAIQILVVIFCMFALINAILKFKKNKISNNELLLWSALWIGILIISIIPGIPTFFADLFGIGRGADVVLYSSVIVLFYLIFQLYSKLETTNKKLTEIVRKIAIENHKEKKRNEIQK